MSIVFLQVMPKRTNKPGISSTNRAPRARGYRGRGAFGRGRSSGFGAHRRPRYYHLILIFFIQKLCMLTLLSGFTGIGISCLRSLDHSLIAK